MGKAKTNDRRVQRTVTLIREAFIELAEERGIEKVTVTDLAERAGINRKTFYHHFDSVDALLDELLEEEAERLVGVLTEVARGEDGSFDVEAFFTMLSQKVAESLRKSNSALVNGDPRILLTRIQPMLIHRISESGAFQLHGFSSAYMEYVSAYFLAGLLAAYQQWEKDDKHPPLEGLAAALSATTVGAVSGLYEFDRQTRDGSDSLLG